MMLTSSRTAKLTLPTDEQILITREFAAPRHLVYRAWTTPDLVERWWTAGRGEQVAVEIDLRVGGKWRYVMVTSGVRVAFHGEYRQIEPNERLVATEIDESRPEAEAVRSLTLSEALTEAGPRTTLSLLVQLSSRQQRDAYLSTMEDGYQVALALLEQVALALR